jgi:hypothetical protein
MVEVEESPTPGSSEALGILDRHIGAIAEAAQTTNAAAIAGVL